MSDKFKSVRWVFDCASWKPTYSDLLFATSCIQHEEKERIDKFVFQKDVKSSLIGRLMMRKYISEVTNKTWNDIMIFRDINGKPYYKHNDLQLNFNISHQGRFTVLAGEIGEVELGVDIMKREYTGGKKVEDFFRIMGRSFANEEWQAIRESPIEKKQINNFFRFWCLKESYVKATGTGITVDLQKIRFKLNSETIENNKFVDDTVVFVDSVKQNNWIFQETLLLEDHCTAVALLFKNNSDKNKLFLQEKFTFVNFKELMENASVILNEDRLFCDNFFKKDVEPY
ncbi:L-aminoadipate-semialdehyde dehydrogenase-phosphopantetheinyl transferase [Rhodnius prolixus]|uniref:L-aminoadipate-semialdehyde dehydrogenase-phosphopantetheinyl transferase n=1 Tax=Rhodnius prolixus TaxID=13249 RepID=T1HCD8_RHOPR